MDTNAEKRKQLADRVRTKQFTLAPGVFDMISARVADSFHFDALYMTGYGTAASHLGLPDAGLTSYRDMVDRAATMSSSLKTPLIADADTGFGGLLNVRHTVRGYEDVGVSAIQIEDQEFPKKCGHTPNRRVISKDDMVRKLHVALEARRNDDFLIIARTDARTGNGLDDAIDRAKAYAFAGADVIFVESPESEAEFARIGKEIDTPLLANMVESGRSPVLAKEKLIALGFSIAIYPSTGFAAATAALDSAYGHLHDEGSSLGVRTALYPFEEMNTLMGFEDVWEFEKRWT